MRQLPELLHTFLGQEKVYVNGGPPIDLHDQINWDEYGLLDTAIFNMDIRTDLVGSYIDAVLDPFCDDLNYIGTYTCPDCLLSTNEQSCEKIIFQHSANTLVFLLHGRRGQRTRYFLVLTMTPREDLDAAQQAVQHRIYRLWRHVTSVWVLAGSTARREMMSEFLVGIKQIKDELDATNLLPLYIDITLLEHAGGDLWQIMFSQHGTTRIDFMIDDLIRTCKFYGEVTNGIVWTLEPIVSSGSFELAGVQWQVRDPGTHDRRLTFFDDLAVLAPDMRGDVLVDGKELLKEHDPKECDICRDKQEVVQETADYTSAIIDVAVKKAVDIIRAEGG